MHSGAKVHGSENLTKAKKYPRSWLQIKLAEEVIAHFETLNQTLKKPSEVHRAKALHLCSINGNETAKQVPESADITPQSLLLVLHDVFSKSDLRSLSPLSSGVGPLTKSRIRPRFPQHIPAPEKEGNFVRKLSVAVARRLIWPAVYLLRSDPINQPHLTHLISLSIYGGRRLSLAGRRDPSFLRRLGQMQRGAGIGIGK